MICHKSLHFLFSIMINNPFSLFQPFHEKIIVNFFSKSDGISDRETLVKQLDTDNLLALKQVHGARVIAVNSASWKKIEADAVFTDLKGLNLAVSFADCQNLVIYEPEKKVIGVVHAGWRGIVAGVVNEAIDLIVREWDIAPADLYVGAGPALCLDCSDFSDPGNEVPALKNFIKGKKVDLRSALESQLWEKGVSKDRFERLSGCTRCEPEKYWTYRGGDREAVKGGYTNVMTLKLQ
ncbi:hypothetical protein A3C52_04040 [Candidatus Peribacteria bacterium RIFCSPHIGHO2_02_FULL_51_15]|nr:MAG: hypothetical protein A3C52_04040 [Candidatus Peribacteria bacterium RIFCSPHIGHO2_02_FULL_51_15]